MSSRRVSLACRPDALRARLGAPAFSRKDGATEMCAMTQRLSRVFLLTGGVVAHVETIPRAAMTPRSGCLNALKKIS